MAMLEGLVATQVKLIQLKCRCRLPLEFVVIDLMTFGMSFKNAV